MRKVINTIKQEQGLAGKMRIVAFHVRGSLTKLACLPEKQQGGVEV